MAASAPLVGYGGQAVRQIIRAFHRQGLTVLEHRSSRNHTLYDAFDTAGAVALRVLLHKRPRVFGKETSVWTLALAAFRRAEARTGGYDPEEGLRLVVAQMRSQLERASHN
jgi:hypothetical protein